MEGMKEVDGKTKRTRLPKGAARRSIHSHPYCHPLEVRRKAVRAAVANAGIVHPGGGGQLVLRAPALSRRLFGGQVLAVATFYAGRARIRAERVQSCGEEL